MKKNRIIIILLIIMLISIANNYYGINYNSYFIRQLIWYLIGFGILFIIPKLNINFIINNSLYLYLFGNFLLLLTLLIGTNVNGASAWLKIGPFSLQPSEFMKIFLILYLRYITINYKFNDFKYIIITFLIVLIPSILTFLEPDTGAVIIYFIIWIVFLVLKKLNKWYYIISISLGLVLISSFFILYYQYQDMFINIFGTNFFYRMDRVTNFIKGDGYQLNEALKSISNSGLFGIKNKVYFPESLTDFALTLYISNFGLIGLLLLLITYTLLFKNLLYLKSDKYLMYPIIYIILFQYSINILMNIGLFPIIGVPLPFLSYGGSSLISYFILLSFIIKEKASINAYL